MADDLDIIRDDIATFRALLDDDARLRDFFVANRDIVRDEADARSYIRSVLYGLDDILHGRVVSQDAVAGRFSDREGQAGLDAAE